MAGPSGAVRAARFWGGVLAASLTLVGVPLLVLGVAREYHDLQRLWLLGLGYASTGTGGILLLAVMAGRRTRMALTVLGAVAVAALLVTLAVVTTDRSSVDQAPTGAPAPSPDAVPAPGPESAPSAQDAQPPLADKAVLAQPFTALAGHPRGARASACT